MNALKSGSLLVALAAPFALYAAWQVHRATRLDADAAPPPGVTGPPRETLAAARDSAAVRAGEVRKAAEVTWQLRPSAPGEASAEPAVDATMKAAADRAADLADLDRFLAGADAPAFAGRLKARFVVWTAERVAAREAEDAIRVWLAQPPAVRSAADANTAAAGLARLVGEYAKRARFAPRGRAAEWQVRGRLAVVDALTALAAGQADDAARARLPLERGTNAVTTAIDTLRGLRAHLALLAAELKRAEEDDAPIAPPLRATAERKAAGAAEVAAREELLALFAKEDLFADPAAAGPWLNEIAALHARAQDPKSRALIRAKVQEFADAFVLKVARPRVATRVLGLAAGAAAHPELFGPNR